MNKLLAQSPFGQVDPPAAYSRFAGGGLAGGPGAFLNMILNVLVVLAGVYALINFILAGYAFLSAGDDPKKIEGAWAKIWQSVIGLVVVAGSFLLAAIFGQLIFGEWGAIINPELPII